jgi:hypothetical protein
MAKEVLETFSSATNSGFALLAKREKSMNYFGPEIVGSNSFGPTTYPQWVAAALTSKTGLQCPVGVA